MFQKLRRNLGHNLLLLLYQIGLHQRNLCCIQLGVAAESACSQRQNFHILLPSISLDKWSGKKGPTHQLGTQGSTYWKVQEGKLHSSGWPFFVTCICVWQDYLVSFRCLYFLTSFYICRKHQFWFKTWFISLPKGFFSPCSYFMNKLNSNIHRIGHT